MKPFMKEREFQRYIIDYLTRHNGYVERTDHDITRKYAMDEELLFKFLASTQPKALAALEKTYKDKTKAILVEYLNREITKKDSSILSVLKHGVEIGGQKLYLLYPKPATEMNDDLIKKYKENIFSVAEEVYASDTERVDLVIFLNGLAIMTFELKCPAAGQTYEHAIRQYRAERDPKDRLFLFKAGAFVHFALDTEECYMTTQLEKGKTSFLPFNRGNGVGAKAGKGNTPVPGKYSTYYMWEDILRGDTILELVTKFIFSEKQGKETRMIFPRFHQLDAVRRVLSDVRENGTEKNYLIQHSAGSGKTNTIAWLAYRLASLHDDDDKVVVDNIVIMTDRIVVDRQLQQAITTLEHKEGLVKVMDDECTSEDLGKALKGNTKIIATTIQKFPHIVDKVHNLKGKRFAVIIDEAHSSTTGRNMMAVTKVLASSGEEELDPEDVIADELERAGKQKNVSMFAFTATPKPKTLQVFGEFGVDPEHPAQKGAFHIYSMKQAIEEGFILDVLRNYTTYDTHYEIVKLIEDDPFFKEKKAKSKIRRFAMLHDTNIAQRVEIIVEHFRDKIMGGLGGTAKGMVVCSSRLEAVKYQLAIKRYVEKKGYEGFRSLVAFSGKVKYDDHEWTEPGMNGISEEKLKGVFSSRDEAKLLVVANKYQTGYDEKKLCAMYVLKSLDGVAAVQTLSRLNRICPPYDKKTFILDFRNTLDDIVSAFAPYYINTVLSNTVTPAKMYELAAALEQYGVLEQEEIDRVWELVCKPKTPQNQAKISSIISSAKARFEKLPEAEKKEFKGKVHTFINWYEFIIQASQLDDHELYKKDFFVRCLAPMLDESVPDEDPIILAGKIDAEHFEQERKQSVEKPDIPSEPEIEIPGVGGNKPQEEDWEERLSKIILDLNSRNAKNFNPEQALHSAAQIRATMLHEKTLQGAAKTNNYRSFLLLYRKLGEEMIANSFETNKEFYQFLLDNPDAREEILKSFARGVYDQLKGEPQYKPREEGEYLMAAERRKGYGKGGAKA